jgi:hypothetical protein
MTWLGISVALSVLLTVILNVGLRLFPNAGRRIARGMTESSLTRAADARRSNGGVRLWTPWKAMILGSVILTIVVNLVLWIARD